MTDRPYTDADLRAEAARQYHNASCDHDYMYIGEQMEDEPMADGNVATWGDLRRADKDAFVTAQRAIDDLLANAADVSSWAIALGVAGLEPATQIGIRVPGCGHAVAVQIATSPDYEDQARDKLIVELTRVITETTSRILGCTPATD